MKELIKAIDDTEYYFEIEKLDHSEILKRFDLFQKVVRKDKQLLENKYGSLKDEEVEKLKKMNVEEQQEYHEYLMKNVDRELFNKKMIDHTKKLVEVIKRGEKEDSKEVQDLIKKYFEISSMIRPISKKKWLMMGISICENKDLYVMYSNIYPTLPEFMYKAMLVYAKKF